MSNKSFLAQFQGAVSTLKSDGRLVSKDSSSNRRAQGASSSSSESHRHRPDSGRRAPAQSLRVSTNPHARTAHHGSGAASAGAPGVTGSPKVRRAAAASAMRAGPSHRPTVRDLDRHAAAAGGSDRITAAHDHLVRQRGSPEQRSRGSDQSASRAGYAQQNAHSHHQHHHHHQSSNAHHHHHHHHGGQPYGGGGGGGGYYQRDSPDARALPQQHDDHYQQSLPLAQHSDGYGDSSDRYGDSTYADDDSYYQQQPNHNGSARTDSRRGGKAKSSRNKSKKKTNDKAFRELSHLKQKNYKDDGLREKRNEKLVKSSQDQLFFSKKARTVTDFKPKTLEDYKATKANSYQVIPSLQPDLEDPELVRKKAIKARQREFSERLKEVNRKVIRSAGPPKKKHTPKVVTKFDRMKEYAANVPKPKVQPIRPSPKQSRSPRRSKHRDDGSDEEDEEMQAQSNIEHLLMMRQNYAAEIEDMKREYSV